MKHQALKQGAAVRLHLYAAAPVLCVTREDSPAWSGIPPRYSAECRITGRGHPSITGPKLYGPHGYRPGEVVTVDAREAIPRDCVRTSRQRYGALYSLPYSIEPTP